MTLSLAHPECTCINACGDLIEGALCPAHPAVRTYAQALVEDLAHRVGVDAIELEDFGFVSHEATLGPKWRAVPIGPNLGYLMSLCFCEHCHRGAEEQNIDIADLRRMTERMIRSGLAGDLSDRRIGDEIADPYHPISRFGRVRAETVATLIDELGEAVSGSQAVLQPMLDEEPDDIWRGGIDLGALRERIDQATVVSCRTAPATLATMERYVELLHPMHDIVADFDLTKGCCDPKHLAQATEACLQSGIERFVFSHYGLIHLDFLESMGARPRL